MATAPTPEESAREILGIFVKHFGSQGGEVLRANNMYAVWPPRPMKDFHDGMNYAAKQGWVTVMPGAASYRLEKMGFDEGVGGS